MRGKRLTGPQAQKLVTVLESVGAKQPTYIKIGVIVGDLHSWLENWKAAMQAYQSALETNPSELSALNNLALVLALSGQRLDVARKRLIEQLSKRGRFFLTHCSILPAAFAWRIWTRSQRKPISRYA